MNFKKIPKLKMGDKVAIVSPSFAAPGVWPHVYELGLKRVREVFGLEPVEFPVTKKVGASGEERANDLRDSFQNNDIKAVIASLGGNDQVTYIKNLKAEEFVNNPKMFFGFSDNTHFCNFLWLNGIKSFYGASLFTQFSMQNKMDDFTVEYIKHAMFDDGEFELKQSDKFTDINLEWNDPETLNQSRTYEKNEGWIWDEGKNKNENIEGISWGGCLESIDELLRHNIQIPTLEDFKEIILFTETSEEMPKAGYVYWVYRALGERGILANVKAVMVGRPKAWEFESPLAGEEKQNFKDEQVKTILGVVRQYNKNAPIILNMDFGHTDPQIPIPFGGKIRIDQTNKKIFAEF
jgi:muramoyltetrapeptide carboxypeptidase LdcA involved in peptidoglycan recycling